MAVLQISKIQIRRGQKLNGVGVPQLSSAEFAWAVDTQELFIGNGSIAEGAPAVGNTKILTEHDNLLELIAGYRFGNENSVNFSIDRSIQSKLDEYVSVRDFGAVGDGETDDLTAFQRALDELFGSIGRSDLKKVLLIPNGVYIFSGNLKIPSTANIRGETRDRSILKIDNRNILFVTEDGEEISNFNSSNRPTNIRISNLTIERTTGQIDISGVKDSSFETILFRSGYILGDSTLPLDNETAALTWENSDTGTKVTGIKIVGCSFESTSLAIKATQTEIDSSSPVTYDTFVDIEFCRFFVCNTAIYINGVPNQGNKWQIKNCEFEEIFARAVESTNGVGTVIKDSRFINCGNGTNSVEPVTSMIYFGQLIGNLISNCSSNRHQTSGFVEFGTEPGIAEVENSSRTSFIDQNYKEIYLSDSFNPLAVFSALNRFIYIDYTLRLGQYVRTGQISVTIDEEYEHASLTDNYAYSPQFVISPGGSRMTTFEFNVTLRSNSTLDDSTESVIDSVLLSYKNPTSVGSTGSISYSITYGV